MRRYAGLRLLALTVGVVGCGDATGPLTPLANAQPLAVSFTTNAGVSTVGAPSATVDAVRGGVSVKLHVVGACAMDASVVAGYAGSQVEVWVTRTANALADCAPAQVGYEYDVTATGLGAGSYDVRVVDQLGGQPARLVGRATVTVQPAI